MLTVAAPIIFFALLLAGWWLSTTLTGIEAWRLPDPLAVARKGAALVQRPTTWRQIAAPVASVVGGNVGGPVGQALAEAVRDLCEVAWPAVTLWVLHVVWYLS